MNKNSLSPKAKKIWVFAFEFAGIAKVGGLGEVSANQCLNLAPSPDLNLTVFLPSHGRHKTMKNRLHLHPIKNSTGKTFIACETINREYFELEFEKAGIPQEDNKVELEFWKGDFKQVPIILVVGKNPLADFILNNEEIYGMTTLNAKLALFAIAMKKFIQFSIEEFPSQLPDIIHVHDHHPLPALLNCIQQLNLREKTTHTIITMHLLTWPRRDLQFYWECGLNNEKMNIQVGNSRMNLTLRELYALVKKEDPYPPTLEAMGCVFADKVIAVSESFLHSDIIPNCGGDLIRKKCDFTWNGCDWEYNKILTMVLDKFGSKLLNKNARLQHSPESSESPESLHSWDFRSFLLTRKLEKLGDSEPIIRESRIKSVLAKYCIKPPYHPDGTVDNFTTDGPLILVTGRVSPQKGIETILDAIPTVLLHFPNARFLFLMIPSEFTLKDMINYLKIAYQFPNNIRFIFGIAGSIYFLSHLAADIYCAPSRWEPFGIVALEAMAARIPVIATRAGGLQESIIPLDKDPKNGTGLLVPIDDSQALAQALVSLLSAMQITERTYADPLFNESERTALLSKIIYAPLREEFQKNPLYAEHIRASTERRVESTFRWSIVSQKLRKIYLSDNF